MEPRISPFSVDNRWSGLCLPRPRGQTGSVAIYSLHLRSIGKTTHAPRTAGAHIRYITRPEARADLLAARMPTERNAARRWLDREERRDRKNARVIDKITAALPIELDALQRRMLVMVFTERVTKGRAALMRPEASRRPRSATEARSGHRKGGRGKQTDRALPSRCLRSALRLKLLPGKDRPSRHGHRLFSCPMFRPALLPLSRPKRNKGLN